MVSKTRQTMRVPADACHLNRGRQYLERQRENLRSTWFFDFAGKRYLRDGIRELEAALEQGEVIRTTIEVPGFVEARSSNSADKKRYFTEIDGLICEIDEIVCSSLLRVKPSPVAAIAIDKILEDELCAAISLLIPGDITNISDRIDAVAPARAVFPGKFETLVSDIQGCTEGLFPHERPDYLTKETVWFHWLDEIYRVAQDWSARA